MNAPLNILAALASYGVKAVIENGRVRLVCPNDNPPPAELIEAARAHKGELHQLLAQEARRDRFEERAAILEFDEGLSRAEAEAIARREMMAGVYDDMQAARDPVSCASALAALRAECRPTSMQPTGSRPLKMVTASSPSGVSRLKLSVGHRPTCLACTYRPKSRRPTTDDYHATTRPA